jgi:hypothetical protein
MPFVLGDGLASSVYKSSLISPIISVGLMISLGSAFSLPIFPQELGFGTNEHGFCAISRPILS